MSYNCLKLDRTPALVLEGYLYYFKDLGVHDILKKFMFVLFNPNFLLQKMQSMLKMVAFTWGSSDDNPVLIEFV